MAPDRRAKISGTSDDESGRDRISNVPDDVLLHILVLLPLVEAIRTCVLSRRWRYVWTRLPLLEFDDDEDAQGVSSFADLVAGVIRSYATDVVMPDFMISVRCCCQYTFNEAVRIAASAFMVAQRASTTSKFGFLMSRDAVNLDGDESEEEDFEESMLGAPLHMPCFPMVTEFALSFLGVDLRMPTTGTFARLTKLYIYGVLFTDDGKGLNNIVSWRCPCLQDLQLDMIEGVKIFSLFSESVLRLRLFKLMDLARLVLVAKNLGKMEVTKCFVMATELTWMLLDLPKLEQLHWEDRCPYFIYPKKLPSQLSTLTLVQISHAYLFFSDGHLSYFTRILQSFERIDVLRLEISIAPGNGEQKNLIENINIPFFGELDLNLYNTEHIFAPTIMNLLNKRYWVTKLSLKITHNNGTENSIPTCPSDCDCHKIQNWRDNKITLPYLKWVIMKKFNGTEDETSLLYSIVRNAEALRKVSIVFSEGVKPPKMFLHTLHKLAPSCCTFEYPCTI